MSHLYLNIDRLAQFAAEFSAIVPIVLFVLFYRYQWKPVRLLLLAGYIFAILAATVIRPIQSDNHQIFDLFWSYRNIRVDGIRWQIYINIFLFVPFGFLVPWAMKCSAFQSIMIGAALSFAIEATQYIFCLGLCELDDVINNTLGTAIGYWYWRGLNWIAEKIETAKKGRSI